MLLSIWNVPDYFLISYIEDKFGAMNSFSSMILLYSTQWNIQKNCLGGRYLYLIGLQIAQMQI